MEVSDLKLPVVEEQANEVQTESRVLSQIRSLEKWYAEEFERRLGELSKILQSQLDSKVEEVRSHYQQETKVSPNQHVPTGMPNSLEQEIRRSEADGQKLVSELERMVADDSVALGKLLQKRSQELELKAYIRGLKFTAEALTLRAGDPAATSVRTEVDRR